MRYVGIPAALVLGITVATSHAHAEHIYSEAGRGGCNEQLVIVSEKSAYLKSPDGCIPPLKEQIEQIHDLFEQAKRDKFSIINIRYFGLDLTVNDVWVDRMAACYLNEPPYFGRNKITNGRKLAKIFGSCNSFRELADFFSLNGLTLKYSGMEEYRYVSTRVYCKTNRPADLCRGRIVSNSKLFVPIPSNVYFALDPSS